MGCDAGGSASSVCFSDAGKAAQRAELQLVAGKFGARGKRTVDQKVGDLLELAGFGDVEDVVAAIVQVIAGASDGAQRRVAGGDAGQSDAFLRPIGKRGGVAHGVCSLVSSVTAKSLPRPPAGEVGAKAPGEGVATAHRPSPAALRAATSPARRERWICVRISQPSRRQACRRAGRRSTYAVHPPSAAPDPARLPGSGSPRASRSRRRSSVVNLRM